MYISKLYSQKQAVLAKIKENKNKEFNLEADRVHKGTQVK